MFLVYFVSGHKGWCWRDNQHLEIGFWVRTYHSDSRRVQNNGKREMRKSYNILNHLLNFLAVILGVYMAFYINEKAKINHDRNESLVLMRSLVGDLSDDIKTYEEYQIPENIKHQKNINELLTLLTEDKIENVNSRLSIIFQVENFDPTTSTYGSMKSSGKLELIEDLALRKKLTNYYEVLVLESIKKGEFQVEFFTSELLKWTTNNVDLLEMKILNEDNLMVFKNNLLIYESLIDQKVQTYEMVVENSKKLKANIESRLK